MKRILKSPSVFLLAILAAVLTYDAFASRGMFAQPTAVATIDLGKVLDQLDERSAKQSELERLFDSMKSDAEPMETSLQSLAEQIKNQPEGARRTELEEQFNLKQIQYASWNQVKSMQLDVEKSIMLRDLYKQIKDAVKDMAEVRGYDIVLVDDSLGELGINPQAQQSREAQILKQISTRRALFTSDVTDITEDLIVRMNNAFNARQ